MGRTAKTDVTHGVWMGGMDDAQTGAMSDVMHELRMGCTYDAWRGGTYDAWTGAMTDILYDVLTVGDFTRFSCR